MPRTPRTVQQSTTVLYLRVSTEEQRLHGVSLEAQAAALHAYCTMRGLEIVDVICDGGISAGKPLATREGGKRLLDLVKQKAVTHVVTLKLDRLFRNCQDCLEVTAQWDKVGVSLHLVDLGGQAVDTNTAMGKFFLTVMAGAAELERNLIGERTATAMHHLQAQGKRVSGKLPYGYTLAADGVTLTRDPDEQEILVAARQYCQAGLSLRQIAARLATDGRVSRTGKPFTPQAIANMVEEVA